MRDLRWLHPIHAKGVRSGGALTLLGKRLTDKRIRQLILQGHYGEAARAALLAEVKPKRAKPDPNATLYTKLNIKP